MKVLYSGILKAVIDPTEPDGFFIGDIRTCLDNMPIPSYSPPLGCLWPVVGQAPRLPEEKWHVTLIHQSILKPYKQQLKGMEFPVPPRLPAITECTFGWRESGGEGDYRRSFVLWFPNPYQQQLKAYVRICMLMLGVDEGDPEPDRRFHISIANLTGKPKDSVR
tara:strand:- start:102 stop:593 length:492 start_codon:yes stop_codon:yes gene_type:complete